MNRTSLFLIFSLSISTLFATSFSESATEPWGPDSELLHQSSQPAIKKSLPKRACIACIHFFQDYISPIDGPRSSFYPTSSQYALEAIERYGVFTGIALGCDRLMRENGEDWVYEVIDRHEDGNLRKYNPVR
ncbi:MAG: putative membrane protein insertion efficiency factor [Chlamydiales bacterium]|nr:putative membrane protein insertion efficiency factor [Chlamydiales bacterium]MCH9636255.1 putative membrane protein insertion efficiency factor [Chlamydiales bacterium]MCH9703307.1 membrane protein insertion efficiency factor YidD [Chlamydiota bacterium]